MYQVYIVRITLRPSLLQQVNTMSPPCFKTASMAFLNAWLASMPIYLVSEAVHILRTGEGRPTGRDIKWKMKTRESMRRKGKNRRRVNGRISFGVCMCVCCICVHVCVHKCLSHCVPISFSCNNQPSGAYYPAQPFYNKAVCSHDWTAFTSGRDHYGWIDGYCRFWHLYIAHIL